MKPKPILTICGCLLLAILYPFIPTQAQKARIGVKAGAIISDLSIRAIDPVQETESKIGGMFGVFFHIPVKGRFSIRSGLEYLSKGAYTDAYSNYSTYNIGKKIQLGYLDIPINLLHTFPLKKNKWFAGGGPVISFLLNKEPNPGFAGNDFGVNILAGYEWAIGASLSLNFTQGLKNIIDDYNGGNVKNHLFGLTIGYLF